MKNKTAFFADVLCIFLLVIGTTGCLVSSFVINVSSFISGAAALIFTLAFSLVSRLVKSRGKFAASISVMLIALLLTAFMSFSTLINQLEYALNQVLSVYSKYLPVADSLSLGSGNADNATVLLVFISALLSFVFSVTLVRAKTALPAAVLSILLLIPCFVLVNTLPSLFSLFIVITVLFTLFATSNFRRSNPAQGGAITLGIFAATLVIVLIMYACNPVDSYSRFEWQDNLLEYMQNLTGIESKNGKNQTLVDDLNVIKDNFSEFKDLSKIGPMKQSKDLVFKVRSSEKGAVYLKGMAYANYEDNVWSVLTDSQANSFPKGYEPLSFTQTTMNDAYPAVLSISGETHQDLIFTPYFLSDIPNGFSVCGDVCIKNDLNLSEYDLEYYEYIREQMLSDDELYSSMIDAEKSLYNDYVYDTYLEVPKDVKSEMLKIAEQNGLTGLDKEKIPDSVRLFVSQSAQYSLNTQYVPSGKDFAVWFLEESDTGYCAHFATAATLMLRTLGIPARYVTGYYANVDDYGWKPVLSGNAHAWTEYYDENVGWIPIDATPAGFVASEYVDVPDDTTSPTEATTQPQTTQPTSTAQPTTKPGAQPSGGGTVSVKSSTMPPAVTAAILIICTVAAVIIVIFARRFIILKRRTRKFYRGRNNEKAMNIYRYILLLSKYSHIVITDEISGIAERAKFSSHTVSREEVLRIRSFAMACANEFLDSCSRIKRLYFKYIIVLK